jgi:hypothetical protein
MDKALQVLTSGAGMQITTGPKILSETRVLEHGSCAV